MTASHIRFGFRIVVTGIAITAFIVYVIIVTIQAVTQ